MTLGRKYLDKLFFDIPASVQLALDIRIHVIDGLEAGVSVDVW